MISIFLSEKYIQQNSKIYFFPQNKKKKKLEETDYMRVLLSAYSGCIFLGRRCMMSVYEYGYRADGYMGANRTCI